MHAYGVLEDIGLFDAGFFGYSPREAAEIDPQ
ncbi:beta-ketoacyl synthase N-terminal-like domain-containing protein [Streptomyces griseoincarnatus]